MYTTFVVFSDEVASAEDDDFMRIFSHHQVRRRETRWWLEQWLQRTTNMSDYHQEDPRAIEGYEEVLQKLLESLPLEERFRGLSAEEHVLALPDETLRALSEDYLHTLSPAAQDVIRQRIGRPT